MSAELSTDESSGRSAGPRPVRHPEVLAQRICRRHDIDPGGLVELATARPHRALRRWRAGDLVIDVATHADGARRLRLEAGGRRWAAARGIATPTLLDADPDGRWTVGAWVDAPRSSGPAYLAACLAAAARIAQQTDLPTVADDATSWRAPRRTAVARTARTVAGGVPPRLWRAAKRQVQELDHPVEVAHGDFYPGNVLGAADGHVLVVDWEYVGLAPRHTDLARLWSVLSDADDRERVLAEMVRGADATERRRVGALLLWHALRLWGENLSAPRRDRNLVTLAHARTVVGDARLLARSMGAWPR
jgi:hypothetical protein